MKCVDRPILLWSVTKDLVSTFAIAKTVEVLEVSRPFDLVIMRPVAPIVGQLVPLNKNKDYNDYVLHMSFYFSNKTSRRGSDGKDGNQDERFLL